MTEGLQLVAHRGYAAAYPENTLPALQAAVDAGARYVEIDVQLTRDAVPVMLHDSTLKRTAGDRRRIRDLDRADLAGLDVGYAGRFGKRFAETRISTLADVADWLDSQDGVQLFVELKRESIESAGLDTVFQSVLPALESVLDRCIIISFDDEALRESRRRCGARTGWVLPDWSAAVHDTLEALQPEFVYCDVSKLPRGHEPLWHGTWEWAIYEVIDPAVARQLYHRGAGMIETMEISMMLDAVGGYRGE